MTDPSPTLSCWCPMSNRVLKEGGATAWIVMDHVLESSSSAMLSGDKDVLDSDSVCDKLYQELDDAQLFSKLQPARTTSEARADDILSILNSKNFVIPTDESPSSQQTHWNNSAKSGTAPSVRGDKSLFLSREYRRREDFSQKHPYLDSLISAVANTLMAKLSPWFHFDLGLTSVQLAVYPGDGRSGYARHCDRGHDFCATSADAAAPSHDRKAERIITAIYYLTDTNWNAALDGGCLRLYQTDNQSVDIVPYRDRLILFRSDAVEHQVLPSLRRPRTAITMWFYGSLIEGPGASITTSDSSNELASTKPKDSNASVDKVDSTRSQCGPPPLRMNEDVLASTNSGEGPIPTIFVSIASYRDSETSPTILNLFSTARYPARVYVGLMLQLDDEDVELWSSIVRLGWFKSNVRCLRMDARHALGPCYARSLCQSLYRNETYVLTIDSHMRFRENWDEYLVQELDAISFARNNSQKVMLTAYPVGYQLPNKIPNETRGTMLLPWKFDSDGMLRQRGRLFKHKSAPAPVPCPFYAAGFNFAFGCVVSDVPYDQSLHHLFFGEELSMAVRLYTHGYDVFTPAESVCYHLWSRAYRPSNRKLHEGDGLRRRQALEVVQNQLRGKSECVGTSFGLGKVRTATDFSSLIGVNFETHVIATTSPHYRSILEDITILDDASSTLSTAPEAKLSSMDIIVKQRIFSFLQEL